MPRKKIAESDEDSDNAFDDDFMSAKISEQKKKEAAQRAQPRRVAGRAAAAAPTTAVETKKKAVVQVSDSEEDDEEEEDDQEDEEFDEEGEDEDENEEEEEDEEEDEEDYDEEEEKSKNPKKKEQKKPAPTSTAATKSSKKKVESESEDDYGEDDEDDDAYDGGDQKKKPAANKASEKKKEDTKATQKTSALESEEAPTMPLDTSNGSILSDDNTPNKRGQKKATETDADENGKQSGLGAYKRMKTLDELAVEKQISKELLTKSFECNLLAKEKQDPTSVLPISHGFIKNESRDINRKGVSRRTRYLFSLPCRLGFLNHGSIGTLANLDTQNPIMYWNFGEKGRLKFFGTYVVPQNTYVTLAGNKSAITCEDVFSTVTIFPKFAWIGTPEENPDEKPLPLPDWMKTDTVPSKANFEAGIGTLSGATNFDSLPKTAQNLTELFGSAKSARFESNTALNASHDEDSLAGEKEKKPRKRGPKSASTKEEGTVSPKSDIRAFLKPVKKAESTDDEPKRATKGKGKRRAKEESEDEAEENEVSDGDSDDNDNAAAAPVTKSVASSRSRRQVKQVSYRQPGATNDDDEDEDEDEDDDEDAFEISD